MQAVPSIVWNLQLFYTGENEPTVTRQFYLHHSNILEDDLTSN